MSSEFVLLKRALSVFVIAGVFSGLIFVPAQAAPNGNVACSGGGYFKILNNVVVSKNSGESGPTIDCVGAAVIPDGVTAIGSNGLYSQKDMTSIVIPDSVTSIGANGIAETGLTRIIMPIGITTLGQGAFAFNYSLTSVIMPPALDAVGPNVFFGASDLKDIYFLGMSVPQNINDSAFGFINSAAKAYVPDGSTGYPAAGSPWKGLTVANGGSLVLYDGNGASSGSAPSDNSVYAAGDPVTALGAGNLLRTGFTFDGWTIAKNGSGTVLQPNDQFNAPVGTTVLYANWLGDPKVTYNGNGNTGGSAPVDPNSPHPKNSSVNVLTNSGSLEKTGYTFEGWNTRADGLGTSYPTSGSFTIAERSVTLYAKWKAETHTVTYNGNENTGGNVPIDGASPHNYNSSVTVLGNSGSLSRTGYDFAGWNTQADGLGTDRAAASLFTISSSDIVLYAKWTPKQIGVTYSGNGSTSGSGMGPNSHNYGSLVTVRANENNLQRTGYDFAGWNTKADGTGTDRAVASTFTIGIDYVELFAKWNVKSYDFAYDGNGSSGGSLPALTTSRAYNSFVYLLYSELTKTGYKFAGWNTKADGSGTQYGYPAGFTMPAENVTLYAQWSNLGSVTYSGNGNTAGTVPIDEGSPHTFGSGVIVLENSGDLVKSGYKFVGWNTEDDGTGTSYAATGLITFEMPESLNVTLFATWEPIPTGTVTYSGNGKSSGSVPVDAQSPHYFGSTVTVSTNSGALKKSGYKFIGWNTASDGSGTSYGSTGSATFEMPESDVTLFATWELIPVVTKPVVKKAITLPRFPTRESKLTGEGLTALKNSVKNSGSAATYTVTGVAGKLPGVPLAYVKALAKVRAERLQAALMKLGVKKSNIKIKIEITEPKIIPRVKISVD